MAELRDVDLDHVGKALQVDWIQRARSRKERPSQSAMQNERKESKAAHGRFSVSYCSEEVNNIV